MAQSFPELVKFTAPLLPESLHPPGWFFPKSAVGPTTEKIKPRPPEYIQTRIPTYNPPSPQIKHSNLTPQTRLIRSQVQTELPLYQKPMHKSVHSISSPEPKDQTQEPSGGQSTTHYVLSSGPRLQFSQNLLQRDLPVNA